MSVEVMTEYGDGSIMVVASGSNAPKVTGHFESNDEFCIANQPETSVASSEIQPTRLVSFIKSAIPILFRS